MTKYKQGDIVLVPFPFTDQEMAKQRPAVVVSANWYNTSRSDCILAAITSSFQEPLARDEILVSGLVLKQTGLLKESIIRAGKIRVVPP